MRKLRLAALACASCQKTETATIDTREEESSPLVVTPSTTTPAPVVAATPAPTPAPEFAPPGRFFARRKLSVETDAGIIGIPAGTALEQTAPGQYRTADGQAVAAADADVTNRLDEARALTGQDRAAQAALRTAAVSAVVVAKEKPLPAAATPSDDSAPRREILRQESLVKAQMDRVFAELSKLSNQNPRTSPAAERLHKELDRLREQRDALREKRRNLQ